MEKAAIVARLGQRNAGFFGAFALAGTVRGERITVACKRCGSVAPANVEVLVCTAAWRCPNCAAESGCD